MKKFLALLLAMAMALSLAACSKDGSGSSGDDNKVYRLSLSFHDSSQAI